MLLFIRCGGADYVWWYWFQYISCYCLSRHKPRHGRKEKAFQYISCYCLSISFFALKSVLTISIHLMLLFIQIEEYDFVTFHKNFNTSHVIVYRDQPKGKWWTPQEFQYISCYCLSDWGGRQHGGTAISIHLMLLFIRSKLCWIKFI